MTRNIYALLIGIDKYLSPVSSLNGCVNDIMAIKEYLEGRVAIDGYELHIRTLLNQDATRQAIIDGFRQHLCQAQSHDIVLFYYSGHGSQEPTPQEFWHLESDRLDETLVCYDSRSPGGWDLADKELAKLIAEVATKDPKITIILDCCHSGSGTRNLLQETGIRRVPTDKRKRPLDSFIFSLEDLEQLSASRSLEESPTGWNIPKGRHILFGACRDSEEAKEYNGDGQQRGAFSYFLLETLRNNGKLTYRDLFKQANALVRSKVTTQSPQFELTHAEDENRFFLDGAIAEHTPYFTVSYDKNYGWVIDGGAVHGIKSASGDETTLLELFPIDTNTEDLQDPSQSVGEAEVTQVLPSLSKVKISAVENLTFESTFKAVVTSLPLPPLGVYFEGDEAGVNLARQALQSAGFHNKPSPYVREEQELTQAQFRLLCHHQQYLIARPADDRPLVSQIDGYTPQNAKKAIQRLEHIARWTTIAELSSPATSQIQPGHIQMQLLFEDKDISQSNQMRLEYKYRDNEWQPPAFRLKLINNSKKPLYCALVDLTDLYAVSAPFFETGSIKLEPGEEAWALDGEYLQLEVSDELWKQGITEYKDIIKLIVSSAEFDAQLITQEALDVPRPPKRDLPSPNQGTLDRLMNRVQQRDIKPRTKGRFDDWYAQEVAITTVRTLDATSVSPTKYKELGAGVKLQPHPSLQANFRLTTVPQTSRDLGNKILPPIFRENPEVIQTFQFTNSRGTDPGLSVLELDNVQNYTVVTPDAPLKLLLDTSLGKDEHLLPVAYNGEFFVPLGIGKTTQEGKTEIELQRLAKPVSQGRRSLHGSIRILFQKVISEKLGLEDQYPLLRVASVGDDKSVKYETDETQIKQLVAQAKRIVLCTHGMIGDTKNLVSGIHQPIIGVDGQACSISQFYDLVLTFDYENINTSIEENARNLKKRLAAVGLGANHGKFLHIIAHSMGGLISRWFIEREAGNQVVQHLMMLGTPNGGSPWSTVQDWATLALGIGLNSLTTVAWPVKVLGSLISAIEAVDVTLDQMKPNSDFLKTLAQSDDPGIPYSIIAGNTSIIPAAMQQQRDKSSLLERLMQSLFGQVVGLPFFGQANDIAVTVHSIKNITDGRVLSPQIQEVACDHLTYFNHPEGLKALIAVLGQEK
ncbi:caspase family protein [Brasilonema sp. UFV-L1]|uniref:caspase family protein n=1 Tax=Brasilonema sp. UFV-L1 TaxID=2234130 RepID=UPI00145D18FA|nr:caspase family protein [Brasilonema sp. UFV-L1]NMG06347.1 caspase [Brasilonema sp. UFV-L1]